MSDFWRLEQLERITGGQWLVAPADPAAAATGLSHDTRTLAPGQLYLAVRGENHDGHRFVEAALSAGAAAAIVSDDAALGPGPVLQVDDTVAALHELASAYRDELAKDGRCKVLAVCGSNGKTTTRHLLHHVLTACGFVGTQSPKSFNNHLGVPLTLLSADPAHDFVACEIGTNHPGEIASLSELVWPDAAIVTSIGREHLAFFKNLEAVAQEEATVLGFVRRGGLVVTPASAAAAMMPFYDVAEGVTLLPLRDDAAVAGPFPLPGQHNRMNAALAGAVAQWMGAPADRVAAAWPDADLPPGRLELKRFGQNVTVLDDSYNANPDSVRAALDTLAATDHSTSRRVAVLGEMKELGSASHAAHAEVADHARRRADMVVLIGEAFGAEPYDENTAPDVAARLQPGDLVLLKASRGVRLERIVPEIENRFGPPGPDDRA